jgi:hypothetical protein
MLKPELATVSNAKKRGLESRRKSKNERPAAFDFKEKT